MRHCAKIDFAAAMLLPAYPPRAIIDSVLLPIFALLMRGDARLT